MKEWVHGYGCRYNHLQIGDKQTGFAGLSKAIFACGAASEFAKDYNSHKPKCQKCLDWLDKNKNSS